MSISIISKNNWQVQQWKNGGGTTNKLCSEKDENGILWRLSIANVTTNGPFSIFPGINRTIILLKGNGFSLNLSNKDKKTITRCFEPFSFAGEDEIQCDLIDGSIVDFNLMTRRNYFAADMIILHLAATTVLQQVILSAKQLLYVANGNVKIQVNQEEFLLNTQDTILLNNETGDLIISALCEDTVVFNISISEVKNI